MERLDELVSLILGLFTPVAISFIKGNTWNDRQKMLASIVVCTIIGALSSLGTHALILHRQMTLDDWITNALVVFTSATATYKLYFEHTKSNQSLEARGPFNEPGNNRV